MIQGFLYEIILLFEGKIKEKTRTSALKKSENG